MEALRRGPALAIATVSVAAAWTLARVFDGASFLPAILGAALIPHAIGAIARARRWAWWKVLALSAIGLGLYVCWTVAPHTTAYGAPTGATWDAIGDAWTRGWQISRDLKAPVPIEAGTLLLAVLGVWLIAQAADLLAFEGRASVGALFPGVVLFLVASALGTNRQRTVTTLTFAVAAALFLLVQQASLAEDARAWFVPRRRTPTRWALRSGLGVTVVALVGAVLITPLLPGAGADPLVDYRDLVPGEGRGEFKVENPVVEMEKQLLDLPDEVMFTSDRNANYYRLATLDVFDGASWTHSEATYDAGRPEDDLDEATRLPQHEETHRIEIGAPLDSDWLPAPYRPISVEGVDAGKAGDRPDLFVEQGTPTGTDYDVTSVVYDRIDRAIVGNDPVPEDIETRYTELPADFPPAVRQLADELTADADTPYDRAVALRDFFRNTDGPDGFEYSQDVPRDSGNETVEHFVLDPREEDGHTGYCEQFSTAFASMARHVGLPTRVVVGFLPGELNPETGRFEIRGNRAHAWTEIYFADVGWIPFDPTPGNGAGERIPGDHQVPPLGTVGRGPLPGEEPVPGQTPPPTAATPSPEPQAPGVDAAAPAADGESGFPTGTVLLATAIVLGVVGLPLAAVGAILLAKRRRRTRRRTAADPRDQVAGAWDEALDRFAEAGVLPGPAATPLEFARDAAGHGAGESAPSLDVLARRYTAACYSQRPPLPDAVGDAWEAVERIDVALAAEVGPGIRWRRRLDPRTLWRRRRAVSD